MTTSLPAKGYFGHTTEYETRSWTALDVPQTVAYADLFEPSFWRHHSSKFKPGHLIRLRRIDGEWDVMLNVVGIAQGGLSVELWPKYPTEADASAALEVREKAIEITEINGKPVPRVDHTPATKWRVIGLDGNEVSRNHATKGDAEQALKLYARSLGKEIAA